MDSKYLHYIKIIASDPVNATKRISESVANVEAYVTLRNTFMRQEYYWLSSNLSRNTTVVDIGANIGDSAIYFSQFDNVKSVIAYEPMPFMFKSAKKNVALLPPTLRTKISLKNLAIGDAGTKRIPQAIGSHVSRYDTLKNHEKGEVIASIPLNQALKGLRNVAIKCDCEGGEYSIFKEDTDLSNVYAIQIEYHLGVKDIVNLLRAKGFSVKHWDTMRKGVGYIYAMR
jgi:FkbM family methyltransferase